MEFTYKLYEGRKRKVLWEEKNGAAFSIQTVPADFDAIFVELDKWVTTRVFPKNWFVYDSLPQTPPVGFEGDPDVYEEPQYLVDRDLTR